MSSGAPIRRCPECGEEFLPHVVNCSDCGALLVSAIEGEAPSLAGVHRPEPPAEEAEYVGLVSGMTAAMAEDAARHLGGAGIPFAEVADPRRGLRLGVPRERVLDAMAILEREGVVPRQPDGSEGVVALEGGPCPACGDHVLPGTAECPGCGLQLSGSAPQCRHCGAETDPAFDVCPDCGREQE